MKKKALVLGIVSAFGLGLAEAATETICQGNNNICGNKIEKFNFGYTAEQVERLVSDAVKIHNARSDVRHKADAETIKNLTTAVTALAQGKTKATKSQVEAAFAALRKGDFTLALSLFEEEAENLEEEEKTLAIQQKNLDELKEKNRKNQVTAQLNIGALAFLDNTQKSLKAYRRATQLDPDNTDGWNRLGLLLQRTGKMGEALQAYQTVLKLGEEHAKQEEVLWAYGNLGNLLLAMGDLDKSESYYKNAIEINSALNNENNVADIYNNLGSVSRMRGDLEEATASFNRAIEIYKKIDDKKGLVEMSMKISVTYF